MDINFRHTLKDGEIIVRTEDDQYVMNMIRNGIVSGANMVITYDDGTTTEFNTKVDTDQERFINQLNRDVK